MNKQLKWIGLLVLCLLTLAGCQGEKSSSGAANGKILYLLSDGQDPFVKSVADAAAAYAAQKQIHMTVADAQNSIEKQIAQIKAAKAEGYGAAICMIVDADTAQEVIAAADGLPVVFVNRSIEPNLLEKNQYVYVGSDNNDCGKYQAEFLKNHFKGNRSIKAVLLQGVKTEPAAIERTESVKDELKKAGMQVEYVFEDSAGWSRKEAKRMFEIFLRLQREFDCVISNNDEMALGVIDACVANGLDAGKIPIVGVDATPAGKQAVRAGLLDFTVSQSAEGQGQASVQAAAAILSGDGISGLTNASEDQCYVWIPFGKVDRSAL